jgi:hypothetical protein
VGGAFAFEDELLAERRRWLLEASNTTSVDRRRARSSVIELYASIGVRGPDGILFLDSPQQCAIAANLLANGLRVQPWKRMYRARHEQLRPVMSYSLDKATQLYLKLTSISVGPDVWRVLEQELTNYLSSRLGPIASLIAANISELHGRPITTSSVGSNVEATKHNLLPQLAGWPDVKNAIEAANRQPSAYIDHASVGYLRGAFDSGEIALAGFCSARGLGPQRRRLLDTIEALTSCIRECGWVIPYETVAMVSDRPDAIRCDDGADGLVREVCYRDGFRVRLASDSMTP